MRTTLALCLLSIICPLTAFAADAPAPLADKLPGSSLVYVGWAGNSDAFQQSMMGQMLQQPAVQEIWKAIQKSADKNGAGAGLDVAQMLMSHPLAAALTDLQLGKTVKSPDGHAGKVTNEVKAVLLADLGKDQAKFAESLDLMLNSLPMNINEMAKDKTVGDVKFKVVKPDPELSIAWGFQGTMLIVGINGAEESVLAIKAEASLAKAERFVTAMKAVGGADVQLAYYADIKGLMPQLLALEKMQIEMRNYAEKEWSRVGGMDEKDINNIPKPEPKLAKFLAALGLDKVTAIAGTTRIVDKSLYSKCKIFSPGPHAGVLAVFEGKPLTKDDLATLPADADFAAMTRIDPVVVIAQTRAILAKLDAKMLKKMDETLADIQKQTGVDVEKDVLGSLGDTWTISTAASQGGSLTGLSMSVSVKDAKKLQAVIDKLEISVSHEKTLDKSERPYYSRRTTSAKAKFGDMEVHYLQIPGAPVAPAWGIYKDRLYVGLWPQVVASTARATGETPGPLSETKGFMAAYSHFSEKPMAVTYTNMPQLLKQFYGFLMLGWTMGSMELQRDGINVSPADLPTIGQIDKFLGASMTAISCDKDGLTFESYSTVPTLGLGNVVALAPLSVAIAMPALAAAREKAKEAGSAMNLSNIGRAMAMYAAEHDDKLPPNLDALIEDGQPKAMLVNPVTGNRDYIYIGPDVPDSESDAIIVFESPDGRENVSVLLRNYCVVRMSVAELKKKLNKSKPAATTKPADIQTGPTISVP